MEGYPNHIPMVLLTKIWKNEPFHQDLDKKAKLFVLAILTWGNLIQERN